MQAMFSSRMNRHRTTDSGMFTGREKTFSVTMMSGAM